MSEPITKQAADVKLIVYACEAGMGSSLMGANQLKKMIKKAKLDIEVVHAPVQQVPDGAEIILTHTDSQLKREPSMPTRQSCLIRCSLTIQR